MGSAVPIRCGSTPETQQGHFCRSELKWQQIFMFWLLHNLLTNFSWCFRGHPKLETVRSAVGNTFNAKFKDLFRLQVAITQYYGAVWTLCITVRINATKKQNKKYNICSASSYISWVSSSIFTTPMNFYILSVLTSWCQKLLQTQFSKISTLFLAL